jgi:hypothetical protein
MHKYCAWAILERFEQYDELSTLVENHGLEITRLF